MVSSTILSRDVLSIDPAAEAERIQRGIRHAVFSNLRRRGIVIGVSGGIDSAVVAALSTRALGKDRVMALFTPENDSSPDSIRLGVLLAKNLGVRWVTEDITPILSAAGCYRRRDDAVHAVVPEYGPGWRCKIVLPHASDGPGYAVFSVVVESPEGRITKVRLTADAYLGIVAATNFKQRVRKMMEYYHADRWQYAVAGTANLLEHNLGFFVKNGDGAADLKPIAHLYKSQVYQIAAWLGIPEEIQKRLPTTDTYPLHQSQEEFYFSLPLADFDLCLYSHDHGIPQADVAEVLQLPEIQVQSVYASIDSKRKATRYLHKSLVLGALMRTGRRRLETSAATRRVI